MICANLLYGKLLKKCYGVEIIPELYESSVTVLDQFRKNILCVTVDDSDSGKKEGNDDVENDTLFAAHRACDMQVALVSNHPHMLSFLMSMLLKFSLKRF